MVNKAGNYIKNVEPPLAYGYLKIAVCRIAFANVDGLNL
jgi:hypothetical protein